MVVDLLIIWSLTTHVGVELGCDNNPFFTPKLFNSNSYNCFLRASTGSYKYRDMALDMVSKQAAIKTSVKVLGVNNGSDGFDLIRHNKIHKSKCFSVLLEISIL